MRRESALPPLEFPDAVPFTMPRESAVLPAYVLEPPAAAAAAPESLLRLARSRPNSCVITIIRRPRVLFWRNEIQMPVIEPARARRQGVQIPVPGSPPGLTSSISRRVRSSASSGVGYGSL